MNNKKIYSLIFDIVSIFVIMAGLILCPATRDKVLPICIALASELQPNVSSVDDLITFNGGIVLDDNTIDYTSCQLTFKIDEDSFISSDDHIAFTFNPISIDCKENLKNKPLIWSLAAYDSNTEKIIPTFYYDNGTNYQCYIYVNETPIENIELVFSGSNYDENTHVLDDYLLDQLSTPNSIIKKVKLVS